MLRYETRGVLAGAYLRSDDRRVYLTHTIRLSVGVEGERRADGFPLCRGVKPDNICDRGAYSDAELAAPPTCPRCLRSDPRFKEAKATPASACAR